eukprot:TRINITY_DN36265_c0_g1_i2.p1 TRINITY_DN36265_c0_g1~~TRINITY_DN36265_c0_g1_i2.p1  ORF type:complete len:216 (+),score=35.30 TRINITY_DN36265_c0_g1_i2:65-649(+)
MYYGQQGAQYGGQPQVAYGGAPGAYSMPAAPAASYGGFGAGYGAAYGASPYSFQGASMSAASPQESLGSAPSMLPSAPSMLASAPSMVVSNPASNPLQSTPSMVAVGGYTGGFGGAPYSSAMDGPFKFYATPPGKLPDTATASIGPAATTDGGAQTGSVVNRDLDVGGSSPASSKKSSKKYTSSRKKKGGLGCC